MKRLSPHMMAALMMLGASGAQALTLSDCDRTTHVSHGGETAHVDLGAGRVMWRDWWSQEGTATDIVIVDCGPGAALRFRTAEDRMNARSTFDRTDAALRIVAEHETGDRVFATLDRMADALGSTARDITLSTLNDEPCACAALYGDRRGDKTEFHLGG